MAWVVRPAETMTSTVTGMMAMMMGSSMLPISAPQLHHAGCGRHEQQREDAGEVDAHLFHVIQLHKAEVQGSQQQHQPVDTGRHRQRQHGVQHLAQKTEGQNARKLKNVFRNGSLLSRSPKNVGCKW